jgi:glycogen operon protein
LNTHHELVNFVLPAHRRKVRWQVVFDTKEGKIKKRQQLIRGGSDYPLEARSMVLLRLPQHENGETKDQPNSV